MGGHRVLALRSIVGAVVLFAAVNGYAQGRMARLTLAEGTVSVGDDPAQLNMPLTQGQTISTGEDGQAEIQFEDGSLARLTPNSSLGLTRLGVEGSEVPTQLTLGGGLAYFELLPAEGFRYTVAAGSDRFSPEGQAKFRVELDEPPATLAVTSGGVRVELGSGAATEARAGESFRADESGNGRYFLTQGIAPDSWDQWNESREYAAADAAARQTPVRDGFAGKQGYGWSDLDANGNWYDVPGQGQVWQPSGGDTADFDPYGNGSWVWYPSAGYVWASAYSWGWTPFRCGGWSYWNGFGWGWVPNASCGGFGFAGFGYGGRRGYGNGGYVNIYLPPQHYPIRRPRPVGGPVHPVQPVHQAVFAGSQNGLGTLRVGSLQPRINGVVARPIAPSSAFAGRGGAATRPLSTGAPATDSATRMIARPVFRGLARQDSPAVSGYAQGAGARMPYPATASQTVVPTRTYVIQGAHPVGIQPATSSGQTMQRMPQPVVARPSAPAPAQMARPSAPPPSAQQPSHSQASAPSGGKK